MHIHTEIILSKVYFHVKYLQFIVSWQGGIKILSPVRIMLLFEQQNSKIILETGQHFSLLLILFLPCRSACSSNCLLVNRLLSRAWCVSGPLGWGSDELFVFTEWDLRIFTLLNLKKDKVQNEWYRIRIKLSLIIYLARSGYGAGHIARIILIIN